MAKTHVSKKCFVHKGAGRAGAEGQKSTKDYSQLRRPFYRGKYLPLMNALQVIDRYWKEVIQVSA